MRCVVVLNLLAAALFAAQAAPADDGAAATDPDKNANAAWEIWVTEGRAACEAQQPACQEMAGVLAQAAQGFESAHRIDRAMAVRRVLIDPRYHLDMTEPGLQAAFALAEDHQALGDYSDAADLYEAAVRRAPKMSEAPAALREATALRLGLGQVEQAIGNVESFQKLYGAKRTPEMLKLMLATIAYFVEHEDFKQAKSRLARAMGQIDRSAAMDEKILAHTWLARSLVRLGDKAAAAREYEQVRALWREPTSVVRTIDPKGDDLRRLGRALTALGEAHFFFAEQKRLEADAIRVPPLRGPNTRDTVNKYIKTVFRDWLNKKRQAIEDAEKEYMKVIRIAPAPPPQWVIASGARVGQLWHGLAQDFHTAPMPDNWKGEGTVPGTKLTKADLRKIYLKSLEEVLEPQRQQAKTAFRTCVDYSVKFQYFDSHAQSCREWLSEHYPQEYPVIRELVPTPGKLGFRIPPQPLTPAGRP